MNRYAVFSFEEGTVEIFWGVQDNSMISMSIPTAIKNCLPTDIREVLYKSDRFNDYEPFVGWCRKNCKSEKVCDVTS